MAEPFKLTPQDQSVLRAMTPDLKAAQDTIAKLRLIGVPVDEQEERIAQAQKLRDGLLQHFSNPITTR